jgi:hypothetical protein
MKEIAILVGVIVGVLFIFGQLLGNSDDEIERMCRQDCSEMNAEYAHHDMGVNGYTSRCSCKKNGDISPIW